MSKIARTFTWLRAGAAALGLAAVFGVTAASAQIKPAADVKIIFVTHGQANSVYWSVLKNGVIAGQQAMGAQVEYHSPETFDVVQMARLIDAAIAAKPDALVVSIPDPVALKEPILAAKAAGIPVGVIDTGIEQMDEWGLDLWVGGNSEYQNGVRAGEVLAEAGVKYAICVNGEVGNIALDDRCNGAKESLEKAGAKIDVVAVTMDPTETMGRVEAYLTAHPDVDGILALGPDWANPTLQRLRETGMVSKVKLGMFDLSPEGLEAIDKGEMLFALDSQQYLQGYLPVVLFTLRAMYGTLPSSNILTGPAFIMKGQGNAVLDLSKQGIR
jgi:simple sugar transport system substrate-binding protein